MVTFKQFLNKTSAAAVSDISKLVAEYNDAGEILKGDYAALKLAAERFFEKEFKDTVKSPHAWGHGPEVEALKNDAMLDLLYASADNIGEVLSLKNKLAKVKKDLDYPLYIAVKQFSDSYSELAKSIKDLKDKVVTVTQKRQEKKEAEKAVMLQKTMSASSLLEVLNKHRQDYIDRAGKAMSDVIDMRLDKLEAVNWKLDEIAPQPKMTVGAEEYKKMKAKRALFTVLVSVKDGIAKRDAEKIKAAIEDSKKLAAENYDSFAHKMINKIGKPVVKAGMSGDPWVRCTITVTTDDGEVQTWTTQMIINTSVYGKLFNQFPTRRQK